MDMFGLLMDLQPLFLKVSKAFLNVAYLGYEVGGT